MGSCKWIAMREPTFCLPQTKTVDFDFDLILTRA